MNLYIQLKLPTLVRMSLVSLKLFVSKSKSTCNKCNNATSNTSPRVPIRSSCAFFHQVCLSFIVSKCFVAFLRHGWKSWILLKIIMFPNFLLEIREGFLFFFPFPSMLIHQTVFVRTFFKDCFEKKTEL